VRLGRPGQVVYSLHDYPWFHPPGQPRQAYFDQMRRNGGYLLTGHIAPVWIGEFGNDTRSLANFGLGLWWSNFQAWVTGNDVDWCWWALNPTSPRAPSRSPTGTGPTGAIQNRGACWPRTGAASPTRAYWTC